jgi:1-deoxy-D-xylulose-5-phosphate reductoisomerase
MGAKITIDSATFMNKGFEVIEAKWLFGLKPEQIEVLIHRQSVIHSMVEFQDGFIKALLGLPDMRLPIQYAFSFPERLSNGYPKMNFADFPSLTFEAPKPKIFRNLALAYEALRKGGNLACILNAANEIAVEAFLTKSISFPDIWKVNELMMERSTFIKQPTLDDYLDTNREVRAHSLELVNEIQHKH